MRVALKVIKIFTAVIFIAGCNLSGPPSHWQSFSAVVETQPMGWAGDAADDPAIWLNSEDPSASLVVATAKRFGLYVYDLSGKELSFLPTGEPNNVDIRELVTPTGERHIVAAVSDRESNSVKLFSLDPNTALLSPVATTLRSELGEIYGLCLYQPEPDSIEIFALGRSGRIERYEAWIKESGGFHLGRLESLSVPSQAEGCVADDHSARLFIAEESTGIWEFDLSSEQPAGHLRAATADGELVSDVEGLALGAVNGVEYLLASSQGNHSFVIYERDSNRLIYVGTFHIVAGETADGVAETDGIELVTQPLSEQFPEGLLVVHDGDNAPANQNFKYISWQEVISEFSL